MLAHSTHGRNADSTRIAFVHGFTQTRQSWDPLLQHLPDTYQFVTIDAPGHGESPHAAIDLDHTANQIVATAGSAVYCGYSMGARMCLHAALAHPESVIGLVLISGTAGIEDDNQRHLRRKSDQQLAQHILDIGVDTFVDEWLSQPMFSTLPRNDEDRALRRNNTASGLANSLTTAGTGSQLSLWNRLDELRMPVLIIAGANDLKFAELAQRLHRSIPTSQMALIEDAGHAVHYEQPLVVASLLQRWLDSRGFK